MKPFMGKRGQSITEYIVVVALIIASVVAMQKWVQRRHQAMTRTGAMVMDSGFYDITPDGANGDRMRELLKVTQYEPYYNEQNVNVTTQGSNTQNIEQGFRTTKTANNTTTRTGTMTTGVNRTADQGWLQ